MNDQTTENLEDSNLVGQLIAAMPGLWDPNFSGTLSLICEHNEEGAIGFVINQPLQLNLQEVLEQTGIETETDLSQQAVLSGGPVSVERGFVLHRPGDKQWMSSMSISDEIMITASDDVIQAMAKGQGPRDAVLILGYAGWGPGQLEQELLDNSWLTLPSTPEIVFDTDFDRRLKLATTNAGIDFSRMSSSSGHA